LDFNANDGTAFGKKQGKQDDATGSDHCKHLMQRAQGNASALLSGDRSTKGRLRARRLASASPCKRLLRHGKPGPLGIQSGPMILFCRLKRYFRVIVCDDIGRGCLRWRNETRQHSLPHWSQGLPCYLGQGAGMGLRSVWRAWLFKV